MSEKNETGSKVDFVKISKLDAEKRICYGEVYAPYEVDSHGDCMLPEDIEKACHRYMKLSNLQASIDTQHDNIPNGSYPVECFIARKGDEEFREGAWVLGVKVEDDKIWSMIKKGDLNGFSVQFWVKKVNAIVEMEMDICAIHETEENENHTHTFWVEIDDDGKVLRGRTSTDNGHAHVIRNASATEKQDGHSHRIFV